LKIVNFFTPLLSVDIQFAVKNFCFARKMLRLNFLLTNALFLAFVLTITT